jgi:DNA-binding IclR family transcriptional regulator
VRNGYYSLGPRTIEMDLQIRLTDPLLLASHGVLEDLVETIGLSAFLCTALRDAVLRMGEAPAPYSRRTASAVANDAPCPRERCRR